LKIEARVLNHFELEEGFPRVRWSGVHEGQNVLVMELLGFSLEYFLHIYKPFSLKTTVMLADQILSRIEQFHSYGFIHRDIKPENLMMGNGAKDRIVHLIDFGLAKPYRDRKTLVHIPFKEGKKLTGTARYVSMATHAGIE
jgi:serine/threonine protein kinase